jgi:GAF domain-containing protein
MSTKFLNSGPSLTCPVVEALHDRGWSEWESELLGRLRQWFQAEFQLFDGVSGDALRRDVDALDDGWVRGQLCRACAMRGRAELIEDEPPLATLAIPLELGTARLVAVGTFVSANASQGDALTRAALRLGMDPADASRWLAAQVVWQPEILARVGQLACERLSVDQRLKHLEREIHSVSQHLSTSYEEISLLYRLTQNLKLSRNDDELGAMALEWMSEVIPAECLTIQLTRPRIHDPIDRDHPSGPRLVSLGTSPLSSADVTRLIEYVEAKPDGRPVVVNRHQTCNASWPWPLVREFVVVPMIDGKKCFGWLLAINHAHGGEFGTVEASLMHSVAAILGIHSGNAELYQQQREFFASVVQALTSAIDAKDPYTCVHSDRVARVAVRLAQRLGCERRQTETVYLAGLLHDVGKIGIDDNVLRKPGKLTESEYEHIKTHAEIGHRILVDIKQLEDVLPVVLHHHEQWDGGGYPHGLAGEAIPFLARVVAVADAFDAMGSDRPYRQGMSDDKLDAVLRDGAGKQWDASVVDAFFDVRDEIREISKAQNKSVSLDVRELV